MTELIEEIRKQMRIKGISSEEMATVARIHLRTFYYRMQDPEQFRLGELVRMCRYLGINYERKSK